MAEEEQNEPSRAPTYLDHAEESLHLATALGSEGYETSSTVNLHHARTYALVSIARSLEGIERHLEAIAKARV